MSTKPLKLEKKYFKVATREEEENVCNDLYESLLCFLGFFGFVFSLLTVVLLVLVAYVLHHFLF